MSITKRVKQLIENKDDFKAVDDFELIEFAKELDKDFVLVPREPTDAIIVAIEEEIQFYDEGVSVTEDIYREVIAAHEGEN